MKICLTGNKGYIGSQLQDYLRIYDVYGEDLFPLETNTQRLMNLSDIHSDAFVHCAAKISVPESFEKPSEYVETNLTLLDKILKNTKTKHFIFISSVSVLEPTNPYSMTKMLGEHMVAKSGVPYSIIRLSNVAGLLNDTYSSKVSKNHIIGAMCSAAKSGKNIKVYGSDYPTYDGTCIRNYVDIKDVIVDIRELITDGPKNGVVYSLGIGNYSNLEIANKIKAYSGKNIEIEFEPNRSNEVPFYRIPKNIISNGTINVDSIIKMVYDSI